MDIKKWFGIKEIIKVKRETYLKRSDKHSIETSFYISSKSMSAEEYNHGIRAHWETTAQPNHHQIYL